DSLPPLVSCRQASRPRHTVSAVLNRSHARLPETHEALQTATLNPARYFGLENEFGTVEEGKAADLVLLDANPLKDIHNTQKIRIVIMRGRVFQNLYTSSSTARTS